MTIIRLDKLLQREGFGSRRHCQALITAGLLRIGGEIIDDWRRQIDGDELDIEVDAQPWRCRRRVFLALHKPVGVECSRRPSHHRGVLTLLPQPFSQRGVQSVGRLDHDSSGLLLLSDDGAFIHAQTHPKRHVSKTYVASLAAPASDAQLAHLAAGVMLDGESKPLTAQVRRLDAGRIELTIDQGKYHQVRRMLAAVGNHCAALHRSAIGALTLDSLKLAAGEWRHLEADEIALLSANPAGLDEASCASEAKAGCAAAASAAEPSAPQAASRQPCGAADGDGDRLRR